jgi:hypothetical protein
MKLTLKGNRFKGVLDIQETLQQVLNAIMKEAFKTYFQLWHNSWALCIDSQGGFFERDMI